MTRKLAMKRYGAISLSVLVVCSFAAGAEDTTCRISGDVITLTTGARTYTIGSDARIEPLNLYVNIAGTLPAGKGIWLIPQKLISAKVTANSAARKDVTASWSLSAGEPEYRLTLVLSVRAGLPALFVKSRVERLSEGTGNCYYYWGFHTPVTGYIAPGAQARAFPNEWYVLPRYRYLYLFNHGSDKGFGIIADGAVGRAPASAGDVAKGEVAGYPYLICRPRSKDLSAGESLDVSFAAFTATDAAAVEAVYRQVGGLHPNDIDFDFQTFSRKAILDSRKSPPAVSLSTHDGLTLKLSRDGRVADLRVGGESVAPRQPAVTGLLLRDFAAKSQPQSVVGTVHAGSHKATQSGHCMNVAVNAIYTERADRIDVHCDLRDLFGKDRALTLYFALPVNADTSWRWYDDIERQRSVEAEDEFISAAADSPIGANGQNSLYPFATICGRNAAIAFGIPLDEPRVCRMVYNAEAHLFFIAWDVALVPEVKRWPSTAAVDFSIFTHDPVWGFRACAKKYYTMFPQFFTKRVKRDGGWVCWGNCADVPNINELGFAYHWGVVGPDAVKWDNEHGIYSLPYVEATNMHQTMEEFKSATSADVVKRLQWIADPKRTEPLPQWKYDFPYSAPLGNRDAALRQSAQAYLNSLLYDSHGNIYGSPTKTEFGLLIAKYIPCDANPLLPGGVGAYFLNTWLAKMVPYFESKGGKVDGIGQDNYHVGDTALSRRREQFPYETIPLTFETATAQPVIVKNFTTFEFTREYKRRNPGKLVIANTCSAQFPFTYSLLDIHGYEWNIEHMAAFARTMAYHKPVCSLPVHPGHEKDAWIKWHIADGFFPGGYANSTTYLNRDAMKKYVPVIQEEARAGWEPVTYARCDNADIHVERFGTRLFTLQNSSASATSAQLRIDFTKLGVKPRFAKDLLSGATYPVSDGKITVPVAANDVVAVQLGE